MKKRLARFLCGVWLMGCLSGCSAGALRTDNVPTMGTEGNASPQTAETSALLLACTGEGGGERNQAAREEAFQPYESFGLLYNAGKNELYYNGKLVRWFEDYYTIEEGAQAGNDFFNENGVVDVYALRDFRNLVRFDDGSFDPSGKLIGVKEASEEEFAARDIEAIKNPAPVTLALGEPLSADEREATAKEREAAAKEREELAKEYGAFGVTYDGKENQWYFHGEKVRFFRDVLTSNGESLTSGKFSGTMRMLESESGTVDIYTVRDFANPNPSGYGTLTGVKPYSQKEFDERTRSSQEAGESSGTCTVLQEETGN